MSINYYLERVPDITEFVNYLESLTPEQLKLVIDYLDKRLDSLKAERDGAKDQL